MAERKTGVVQYKNDKQTKVGTTWNLRLEGDERYFGCYKTEPSVSPGDCVEFEFSENAQGFVNIDMKKGIKVLEGEVAESAGVQQSAEQTDRAKAALNAADLRDKKITWQSARAAAINVATIAQAAGVLDLGKGGGSYEALQIIVNAQTVEFFEAACLVAVGEDPFDDREAF